MGQPGDHRPEGLKEVIRVCRKGPRFRKRLSKALPPEDPQLVPGLDIHAVVTLDPVLLGRGGGGLVQLQPGGVRLVDPAGDVLRDFPPLVAGQSTVPDRLYPVDVHAVCIPVSEIHMTYVPPMPTSRAFVARSWPYWVALRSPQLSVAFVSGSVS